MTAVPSDIRGTALGVELETIYNLLQQGEQLTGKQVYSRVVNAIDKDISPTEVCAETNNLSFL